MAYSDYTLSIEARWASEEHKEIFVEVDWPKRELMLRLTMLADIKTLIGAYRMSSVQPDYSIGVMLAFLTPPQRLQ